MTRRTLKNRWIIAAALSVTLPSAVAMGAKPEWIQLAEGIGGPEEKDGGAGNEQAEAALVDVNGVPHLVTVYMSSDVENGNWQCKCQSVKLTESGPEVVASRQLTDYDNGDRLCNHPDAASDGKHVVWMFGSDTNNDRPRTYAGVLDHMCNHVVDPFVVSEDDNQNEGAPDVVYNGNGRFTGGYLSTNNKDTSYAVGLELNNNGTSLEKTYLQPMVSPSNIGRPAIVALSPDRSVFCAAKGDQRPPEDGVECNYIDSETGEVLAKDLIFASDKENGIFMNQPQVALLDDGKIAVQAIESSGEGKKKNGKGASMQKIAIVDPSTDGFLVLARGSSVGPYQAHSGMCSGLYGPSGERHMAVIDAPITGSGLTTITLARFMGDSVAADENDWVAGPYNGDSGYIANKYGHNPNNQGRDYLRCIGDVPNPGFGKAGGFMSESKSLFVVPYTGRKPDEPKNALFMSFIPGAAETEISAENPSDEPSVPGVSEDDPMLAGTEGGCSVSAPSSSSSGWAFGLLGLAWAAAAARKRRQ